MLVEAGQGDPEPLGHRRQGQPLRPELVDQPGRLGDHDVGGQPGPRHARPPASRASATSPRRLRLRVVADARRHHHRGVEPLADPAGLGGGVLPVHVVGAHHHGRGCPHVVEPGLRRGVGGAGGGDERLPVAGPAQVRGHGGGVLVVPLGADARGPLRVVAAGRPPGPHGFGEGDPEHQRGEAAAGRVADERADQHQAADRVGTLRRGDHRGAGAHRVADDVRRAAELVDERESVRGEGLVVVGAEGGVAVAVAAEVQAGHPVAAVDEQRDEVPVRRAELAHRRQADDQGTGPGDVVREASVGTREELASSHSQKANQISHAVSRAVLPGAGRSGARVRSAH